MFTQAKHHYILMLATLSGVCGIAYEILYARMLSTYFGDIFYVTAAILVGFLASIGIGALIAHRYAHYLPYIEIGIGVYGLLAAYMFSNQAASLVQFVTTFTTIATPAALVATVLVLLAVPAVLIGFSIPLFTIYLTYYRPREDSSAGFRHTYLLYNLGAALSILAIEFALIHLYGITVSIITIAATNFLIGLALLRIPPPKIVPEEHHKEVSNTPDKKYMTALFLVSTASGIFQLLFLKVVHSIFGPLNENFAVVIATVFAGMAIGAFIVQVFRIRFVDLLLAASAITIITFLVTEPLIYLWAYLQGSVITTASISALAKTVLLSGWGIMAFTAFGAAIPVLLRERPGDYVITPGRALAVSAFGNAFGFLGMIFVLHENFSEPAIAIVIASFSFAAATMFINFQKIVPQHTASVLVLGIALLLPVLWPATLLHAGFERIQSLDTISYIEKNVTDVATYRHYNDSAHVLTFKNGVRWLTHNGNSSLRLPQEGPSFMVLETTVAGIAPALFSKEHDDALVIGLGAGITAGATASVYERTRVVDVNSVLPEVISRFKKENLDVLTQENTDVLVQDGIVELLSKKEKYDLIIATIASASYYPANKLRTQDAYEIIKDRLADGGVYSSWFSARLGEKGVHSTVKTLEESFADCKYMLFLPGLLNVVCSEEKLEPDLSYSWPSSIQDRLSLYGVSDTSRFLNGLVMTETPEKIDETVPLNTFDYPFLEFSDTLRRLSPDTNAVRLMQEFATTHFPRSPYTKEALSQAEIEQRCKSIDTFFSHVGARTELMIPACRN